MSQFSTTSTCVSLPEGESSDRSSPLGPPPGSPNCQKINASWQLHQPARQELAHKPALPHPSGGMTPRVPCRTKVRVPMVLTCLIMLLCSLLSFPVLLSASLAVFPGIISQILCILISGSAARGSGLRAGFSNSLWSEWVSEWRSERLCPPAKEGQGQGGRYSGLEVFVSWRLRWAWEGAAFCLLCWWKKAEKTC